MAGSLNTMSRFDIARFFMFVDQCLRYGYYLNGFHKFFKRIIVKILELVRLSDNRNILLYIFKSLFISWQ